LLDGKWRLIEANTDKGDKCQAKHCRQYKAFYVNKKERKVKKKKFCHRCAKQMWRANNPARDAFNNLRSNAKRRGHEFTLTLNEFLEFCEITGYMDLRGNDAHHMTIDRIDNTRGYSADNIQMLTRSENAIKYTSQEYVLANKLS